MTDMGEEKKSHMTAGIRHLAFSIDDGKFMPMVEKLKEAGAEVVTDVSVSPKGLRRFSSATLTEMCAT